MDSSSKDILEYDISSSNKIGISITKNWLIDKSISHNIFVPHRDKQYILIVNLRGTMKLMLDFKELSFEGPFVLLIQPEQVHQLIAVDDVEVYNIDFLPDIISAELQGLLHQNQIHELLLSQDLQQQLAVMSGLMHKIYNEAENIYHHQTIHSLLLSILNLIIGSTLSAKHNGAKDSRTANLEQQFQILLKRNYKTWKRPSQYASFMSISVSHLNDTVNKITGYNVSQHIQRHLILEAKRYLFFSKKNVKEICYELGFEDPVYFNKLFKKVAGVTPMQFRSKLRD